MYGSQGPHIHQGLRQSQKQTQRLMMLPHMQQALALLQLPVIELAAALEAEMEQNPLIDHDVDAEEASETEQNELEEEEDNGATAADQEVSFDETDFSLLNVLDEEFREHFTQDEMTYRQKSSEDAKRQAFLEGNLIREMTLNEFLMQQATETFSEQTDRQIAEILIGYLDENGYLETPLQEIADLHSLALADIERVLSEIQRFDPIGVASTSLKESLLTQLKHKKKENQIAYQMIEHHWDDLLHHHIPAIAKRLHTTNESIATAIRDDIASLDFHPGNSFGSQGVQPIIPDLTIRMENDELAIVVNQDPIPQFRFNRRYLRMLEDPTATEETKEFLRQKLSSAKWLNKVVDQRHDTLHRIGEALIQHQSNYLKDPKGTLVPLTMKSVAEEIGVHESTVARAVANKYAETPRGLISLRSFFTNALIDKNGSDVSSRTVREAVEDLIKRENKTKPFSDEAISKLLQAQGLLCARRTIAKYRGELSIGNAGQRKTYS